MTKKDGYWFTTKTGKHVHAEEGETPEEATKRLFGNEEKKFGLNEPYDRIIAKSKDMDEAEQEQEYKQEESPSLDELLGEEFKGYKGQAAVDKLLQEKRGHVKGAFHREDIGDIDLLWGSETLGLQHIIKQRETEKPEHAQEIMDHLSDAVEKGEYKQKNERGNFVFSYKERGVQYRTIIAPEYHNHKITYVLTAFRRGKKRQK